MGGNTLPYGRIASRRRGVRFPRPKPILPPILAQLRFGGKKPRHAIASGLTTASNASHSSDA